MEQLKLNSGEEQKKAVTPTSKLKFSAPNIESVVEKIEEEEDEEVMEAMTGLFKGFLNYLIGNRLKEKKARNDEADLKLANELEQEFNENQEEWECGCL